MFKVPLKTWWDRFGRTVVAVGGAATTAVAVVASPSWPLAVLLAALIILGCAFALFVERQFNHMRDAFIEQGKKLDRCETAHKDCSKELHLRDVLLGMFFMHAQGSSGRRTGRDRRKIPPALEHAFVQTLGPERAQTVIDEARRMLSPG